MIQIERDISSQLGPVRRQGRRPTCLAFTASDLNAAAHEQSALSVEYLCHYAAKSMDSWTTQGGFTIHAVLRAARKPGQPSELAYPYRPDHPDTPLTAPEEDLAPLYASTSQRRGLSLDEVDAAVTAGRAAGVVIAATESLLRPSDGIVSFDPLAIPQQYHAMVAVAVGTHTESGERHLMLRNSWGPAWGYGGHAWIPQTHLRLHWLEGLVF